MKFHAGAPCGLWGDRAAPGEDLLAGFPGEILGVGGGRVPLTPVYDHLLQNFSVEHSRALNPGRRL